MGTALYIDAPNFYIRGSVSCQLAKTAPHATHHERTNTLAIPPRAQPKCVPCRAWWWRGGWPVINPYNSVYSWWCFYVLLTDATYTAFIVPIAVGFDTSDEAWNWVGYCDFIAGEALSYMICRGC